MAMELLVVLALDKAPRGPAWRQALEEQRTPVRFSDTPDLARDRGFLTMTVQGRSSGFYFLTENFSELRSLYPALAHVNLKTPVVFSLGYGGHFLECGSVFYAASALVARFGGMAFDPQGNTFMTELQLTEAAKQCLELAKSE
jgi:hypothetical protein